MKRVLQLIVSRRGLDPEAWTALHALQSMQSQDRVVALAVAHLWEFHWKDSSTSPRDLQDWVSRANWFANPSRDLLRWRESGTVSISLADSAATTEGRVGSTQQGAFLLVSWLGGEGADEHGQAARRIFGESFELRRTRLWWLATESGDARAYLSQHASQGSGGLLLNPNSQTGKILGSELPFPLFEVGDTVSRSPDTVSRSPDTVSQVADANRGGAN